MRKKTIRRMNPTAKKLATLLNETQSIVRRLKNIIQEVNTIEQSLKHLEEQPPEIEGKRIMGLRKEL